MQVLERHPRPDEVGLSSHAEHRGSDALTERGVRRKEQVTVAVQHIVLLEGNLLDRRYLKLGQVYADTGFIITQINNAVLFRVVLVFGIKLYGITDYDIQVFSQ